MSYAHTNSIDMYYEEHGSGDGTPLVLLHGGIGGGEIFAAIAPQLATGRRVIVPDLHGHGRTADIDRPLRAEDLADDVAGLLGQLGLAQADVMGYSLGGAVAWRIAIQHPGARAPARRDFRLLPPQRVLPRGPGGDGPDERGDGSDDGAVALLPALRAGGPAAAGLGGPTSAGTADMLKIDFDWTDEVTAIEAPTMLVFADSDSVMPDHVAELFRLRGGGLRDAGWDGSAQPVARLAVLPGPDALRHDRGARSASPPCCPFLD